MPPLVDTRINVTSHFPNKAEWAPYKPATEIEPEISEIHSSH